MRICQEDSGRNRCHQTRQQIHLGTHTRLDEWQDTRALIRNTHEWVFGKDDPVLDEESGKLTEKE